MRVGLFSQAASNGRRENGLKLHQGRFRLDLPLSQKNFLVERVVKCWNELPKEVAESPSLEVFKEWLVVAHSAIFGKVVIKGWTQ